MSAAVKMDARGSTRTAPRIFEVECPAWAAGVTRIREPTIADWLASRKIEDDAERSLLFLSRMVLDEAGEPVGAEAVHAAPLAAMQELLTALRPILDGVAAEGTTPLA